MNLNLNVTIYTKINSKRVTDLNLSCKSIKLLEENTVKNIHDLGLGKEFLNMIPKAQSIK